MHLSSLELGVLVGHKPDAEDQLLCIVIIENAVEVIPEVMVDLLRNLFHRQLLVCHPLPLQLQPVREGGREGGREEG